MGLFSKFFSGLQKTQSKLSGELKRIVSRSPKFTEDDAEELEAVLLASDMGFAVTEQIVDAVREKYQSGGNQAGDVLQVAQSVVEENLGSGSEQTKRLAKLDELTVVSLVGVNGAGKTTTAAKLANRVKAEGASPMLAACDTFRAAAAARKVSQAASMGLAPSAFTRFANLAAVVVFPAPLTPTSETTVSSSSLAKRLVCSLPEPRFSSTTDWAT